MSRRLDYTIRADDKTDLNSVFEQLGKIEEKNLKGAITLDLPVSKKLCQKLAELVKPITTDLRLYVRPRVGGQSKSRFHFIEPFDFASVLSIDFEEPLLEKRSQKPLNLDFLGSFQRLRSLSLEQPPGKSLNLPETEWPDLVELNFRRIEPELRVNRHFPNLRNLDLTNVTLTGLHLESCHLDSLIIGGSSKPLDFVNFGEASIAQMRLEENLGIPINTHRLETCRDLATLTLVKMNSISDLDFIGALGGLKVIILFKMNGLRDIKALSSLHALEALHVQDCPLLDPESMVFLNELPFLREVTFEPNSPRKMEIIRKMLSNHIYIHNEFQM